MPTFLTDSASFYDLSVSGSTIMSASNSALTTRIIGSGSNILVVSGSTGGMLNVTDTINQSIFSVSSGSNTILDVSSVAPYLFSVSSGSNTILAVDSTRQVIMNVSGSATTGIRMLGIPNQTASFVLTYISESGVVGYTTSSFTSSYALGSSTSITSSYPIWVTGSTIYSTGPLSTTTPNTTASIFLGVSASFSASNTPYSIFLGNNAGWQAYSSQESNFIGASSGYRAFGSRDSNFIGIYAGYDSNSSSYSNIIGYQAGSGFNNISSSNFIGTYAGYTTTSPTSIYSSNFIGTYAGANNAYANLSNFIGASAGQYATSASGSNFIGYFTGFNSANAAYSNLIGYNVANTNGTGIGSNNIIIGTNITLPDARRNSINIGGIFFGTGSYSTITGNPTANPNMGRIGINVVNPIYTLEISGSGISGSLNTNNVLYVTSSRVGINVVNPTSNLYVGGTTIMSSSADLITLTILGSGSELDNNTANPIVYVTASKGDIMTVWDRMSGSLFEVNKTSGDPILQINSDNVVKMGIWPVMGNYTSYRSTIPSGSMVTIYTIPASSSNAAFFDYVLISGSNLRAGNFITTWGIPNTITYIETSTHDIGNTSFVTMSADISSNQLRFRGGSSRGNWEIRTIIRYI